MILFINKRYNNRNGAEKSGSDVVNSLLKAGASVSLLYIEINNNFKDIYNSNQVNILKSPKFKQSLNKYSFKEIFNFIESKIFDHYRIHKIKSLNIKFIIANSLSAEYYAKNLSKILNVKCCLIVRESTEFYKNPNITINRINFFNQIVFVSSNVMKKWISVLPELELKSIYIPNTIQESSIKNINKKSKIFYKQKLNFDNKKFNIIIVGKFIPRKNQSLIINNLNKFNKLKKKIKFHFIGKNFNSYGNKMKCKLKKKSNKNSVSLYGFKKNVLEYIYASDCLILTAMAEASPRVIYEAMALNTAVIASDVGGVSELIIDNHSGFLYKKNDIKNLIFKIEKLLDLSTKNKIVKNAYKNYYNFFSNEIHQRNYKKLLKLLQKL